MFLLELIAKLRGADFGIDLTGLEGGEGRLGGAANSDFSDPIALAGAAVYLVEPFGQPVRERAWRGNADFFALQVLHTARI